MKKLTKITVGIAANRLRKLQANFDFWYPQRAQYPFVAGSWQQEMAEKECLRLGPKIVELKQAIAEFESCLKTKNAVEGTRSGIYKCGQRPRLPDRC